MMNGTLKSYSILYAEDNKAIQHSTEEYLKRYFKNVYVANDGKEVLALYKSTKVDVLLLDIDMPYIDGLSVAKEVRIYDENIPILMLTAFTDTDMLLEATELNLCKYLVKPINPTIFKEALQLLAKRLEKLNDTCIYLAEEYKWDMSTKILYKENIPIVLSQKEQVLLSLLMKHYNHCVTFEEIMAIVWVDEFETEISIESIKQQIARLRKKLPKDTIKNVYGKGYLLK